MSKSNGTRLTRWWVVCLLILASPLILVLVFVALNWSRKRQWRFGLAPAAFHYFGGYYAFNPLAVVFRPLHRARVFRFWQPFRDWKHGHGEPLRQMETELFALIGAPGGEHTA